MNACFISICMCDRAIGLDIDNTFFLREDVSNTSEWGAKTMKIWYLSLTECRVSFVFFKIIEHPNLQKKSFLYGCENNIDVTVFLKGNIHIYTFPGWPLEGITSHCIYPNLRGKLQSETIQRLSHKNILHKCSLANPLILSFYLLICLSKHLKWYQLWYLEEIPKIFLL